jgi:DNA primase
MLAGEERIITSAVARVRKRQQEERHKEREREARAQGQVGSQQQQSTPQQPQPQGDTALTPEEEAIIAGVIPDTNASEGAQQEAEAPTINIKSARRDSEKAILQTEALVVQMIVRYGELLMGEFEDNDGQLQKVSVAEFISLALEQDDLTLHDERHRQILAEALEHIGEEGFRCNRYFENHPDLRIAELATELAHDPETLSKIHEKSIPVKPEEERLMELVPHVITDYKLAIVDDELHSLMQQLCSKEVLESKELSGQLMQRYQELKQVQGELGRVRGDRVMM